MLPEPSKISFPAFLAAASAVLHIESAISVVIDDDCNDDRGMRYIWVIELHLLCIIKASAKKNVSITNMVDQKETITMDG